MSIEAVVGDEELTPGRDGAPVGLIRILYSDLLRRRRKPRRQNFRMLDESQAVTSNKQLTTRRIYRRRRRSRTTPRGVHHPVASATASQPAERHQQKKVRSPQQFVSQSAVSPQ